MSAPTRAQLLEQIADLHQQLDEAHDRADGWRKTAIKLSQRLEAAARRERRTWWRP